MSHGPCGCSILFSQLHMKLKQVTYDARAAPHERNAQTVFASCREALGEEQPMVRHVRRVDA